MNGRRRRTGKAETPVVWPDPSPLESWWDSVMDIETEPVRSSAMPAQRF